MKHKLIDFDFIFLSYDEPNAELLYAELEALVPWAKRVQKIKGFDTAHRACADASETNFFVTVDGDNRIDKRFLELDIDIEDDQHDHAWTWAGRNIVNGLVYGNGGLKLWSKEFVYNMNSHENSTDGSVDFCWSNKYHEVLGCYSTSIINSSPMQAWRSGFREGVKMTLDRGNKVKPIEFQNKLWYGNVNRLCIWSSIGQDVENGIWSIYGARLGCYTAMFTDWDVSKISDYDEMYSHWNTVKDVDPIKESLELGNTLTQKLGLDISLLSENDSRFFKRVYVNPPRPWLGEEVISHFMAKE